MGTRSLTVVREKANGKDLLVMNTAEYLARWNAIKNIGDRLRSGPPPDHFHLITTGHLTKADCEQYGFRQIRCSRCQEHGLDLIWRHEPLKWPIKKIPGTVWGKDVTPICPCCSFPGCTHKEVRAA
jgi:hypothetical protein